MCKKWAAALAALAVMTVAGCGTTGEKEEAPVDDKTGASAAGVGAGAGAAGMGIGGPGDPLAKRRVYFEFDSAEITAESRTIIEAHSRYLANNPRLNVVLEGHADERGTREYNLALGEHRSHAVSRAMQALGVTGSRIQTVSYGEERPVALEQNESAWAQNRRVEILYGN
jgi:peptidoglycan-associated lipoprotein